MNFKIQNMKLLKDRVVLDEHINFFLKKRCFEIFVLLNFLKSLFEPTAYRYKIFISFSSLYSITLALLN